MRCCQRGAVGARAGQHEFGYEATLRHIGGLKPTASLRFASLPPPPPHLHCFILTFLPNSTAPPPPVLISQRTQGCRHIDKVIALPYLDPRHPRPPGPGYARCTRAITARTRGARSRRHVLQSGGISSRVARTAPGSCQSAKHKHLSPLNAKNAHTLPLSVSYSSYR